MDQNPTKEPRPAANLRIKFRSDNLQQFIERYAMDVSRGGIFIRTREPLAVGTPLKLDFQYQGGSALLGGEGTVVWVREFDANRGNVPPGMGVRFDRLNAESQSTLDQILIEKTRRAKGDEHPSAADVPRMTKIGMPAVRAPAAASAPAATDAPVPVGSAPAGPPPVPRLPAPTPTSASTPTSPATVSDESSESSESSGSDDLDEEPTQIASGLPSFLALGGAAEGGRRASSGANDAARRVTLPPPSSVSHEIAKPDPIVAPTDTSGPTREEPPPPTPNLDAKPDTAPARPSGDLEPSLAAVFASRPSAAAASSGGLDDADVKLDGPGPTPAAGGGPRSGAKAVDVPEPPSSAHARSKRLPASFILLSVVALGAASFFLVRFFHSQATETLPARQAGIAPTATAGPEPAGTGSTPTAAPATATAPATPPTTAPPVATGTATGVVTGSSSGDKPASALGAPSEPRAEARGAEAEVAGATRAAPTTVGAGGASGAVTAPDGVPPVQPKSPPAGSAVTDASEGKRAAVAAPRRKPARAPRPIDPKPPSSESAPIAAAAAPVTTATRPEGVPIADPAADATLPPWQTTAPPIYQLKVTSKPVGADVSIDGRVVGKTPYTGNLTDVGAAHVLAVKKDGFEPFEQTVDSASAWVKAKTARGAPVLQQLRVSPKLRSVAATGAAAGAATTAAAATATEAKPATGDKKPGAVRSPDGTGAAKPGATIDNTLPPSEPKAPADGKQ